MLKTMNQIFRSISAFIVSPIVPIVSLSVFVLGADKFLHALPLVAFFCVLNYGICSGSNLRGHAMEAMVKMVAFRYSRCASRFVTRFIWLAI